MAEQASAMVLKERFGSLKRLVMASNDSIAQVLPQHVTVERVTKIFLGALSRNPRLLQCTSQSLMLCLLKSSELGLEPGGALGEAHLVPFYNGQLAAQGGIEVYECTLIPGYKGLEKLVMNTGLVRGIRSRVVHANDAFEVFYDEKGDHVTHKPMLSTDRGPVTAAYMFVDFKDEKAPSHFEVMSREELDTIKRRALSKKKGGGSVSPWETDESEMQRKTVIRRGCKHAQMSTADERLADALELQRLAEEGEIRKDAYRTQKDRENSAVDIIAESLAAEKMSVEVPEPAPARAQVQVPAQVQAQAPTPGPAPRPMPTEEQINRAAREAAQAAARSGDTTLDVDVYAEPAIEDMKVSPAPPAPQPPPAPAPTRRRRSAAAQPDQSPAPAPQPPPAPAQPVPAPAVSQSQSAPAAVDIQVVPPAAATPPTSPKQPELFGAEVPKTSGYATKTCGVCRLMLMNGPNGSVHCPKGHAWKSIESMQRGDAYDVVPRAQPAQAPAQQFTPPPPVVVEPAPSQAKDPPEDPVVAELRLRASKCTTSEELQELDQDYFQKVPDDVLDGIINAQRDVIRG